MSEKRSTCYTQSTTLQEVSLRFSSRYTIDLRVLGSHTNTIVIDRLARKREVSRNRGGRGSTGVSATPMSSMFDDDALHALIESAKTHLRDYENEDGSIDFAAPSHIILGS